MSYSTKTKVIFICTGNSARSQMAEALLRHHGGDRYEVFSAGVEPKGIHPLSIKAMTEKGLSLAGQSSDHLDQYLNGYDFGIVVTVCSNAEESCPRSWLQAQNHLHWLFDDPAAASGTEEEKMIVFRRVRDQIEQKIVSWLDTQN
ncbi:MAG: arsenate reductase ArsC [Ardenticatenaceae bacterium]|nr:arsenate reductase ArsC [Ardenticatenaceae bacterium]